MTLVPGNNTLPMTGIVDQGKIVSSTNSTTGMVTLEIVGQSAVYNGQHLPYYVRYTFLLTRTTENRPLTS